MTEDTTLILDVLDALIRRLLVQLHNLQRDVGDDNSDVSRQ